MLLCVAIDRKGPPCPISSATGAGSGSITRRPEPNSSPWCAPAAALALEPARELSEIVGYRAIETRPGSERDGSGFPEALAETMALPDPDRTG